MRNFITAALLVLYTISAVAAEDDTFEIETEGSYIMDPNSSIELAEKVAFFSAKRKAVELAGRYLSRRGLIEAYELNKDEIYSLAAREIQAKILAQNLEKSGETSTYRLRIRARIETSDFIKADLEDAELEKKEAKESYREEMEQPISAAIDPGRDIAKAYRLLREKKWRIAMIYLNHLEKKYPNWDSIYTAKAITHFILHEPEFMKKALDKACRLGNRVACDELMNLKMVHKHDFSLPKID